MEELYLGPPNTNPYSDRENDLNLRPPDHKSSTKVMLPDWLGVIQGTNVEVVIAEFLCSLSLTLWQHHVVYCQLVTFLSHGIHESITTSFATFFLNYSKYSAVVCYTWSEFPWNWAEEILLAFPNFLCASPEQRKRSNMLVT